MNLAIIMLLSPKIWLLFPSGAAIVNQLTEITLSNALILTSIMMLVVSVIYVLYTAIGEIGTRLLKDNFSYLATALLLLFAVFLFNEAFNIGFTKSL